MSFDIDSATKQCLRAFAHLTVAQNNLLERELNSLCNTMASSLPTAIKLATPSPFDGSMSVDALESFFFRLERYYNLTNLTDEN